MNVFIKEGGKKPKKFRIILPTSLILNRFTAGKAVDEAKKNGVEITKEQMIKLFEAAKQFKRRHRDWVFVEVSSLNGDEIKVKL